MMFFLPTPYRPARCAALPRRRPSRQRWALLVCASLGSAAAFAQSAPPARIDAAATIDAGVLSGAQGSMAVNQTAGIDNAQSNDAVLATGVASNAQTAVVQQARTDARTLSARAQIAGNAFSNVRGVVAVNQSAGAANLQRNVAVLGGSSVEVEAVADSVLSAATASPRASGRRDGDGAPRSASIGIDAFKGAAGVVQVNQTAGAGNATANSFVLRSPGSTFF